MHEEAFAEIVNRIRMRDERYNAESYFFLREALDYTSRMLKKPADGERRHVTGKELLEGIRAFALQELGPMSLTVFRAWGVRTSEDFGNIVFNLVDAGVLGRTERDQREDFKDGYEFHEVFVKPFLPNTDLDRHLAARQSSRIVKKSRGQP